jgi:Ser/Thr protein kinase RdoA (MazF antagonist)
LAPGNGDPPGLHARLVAGAGRHAKVGFPDSGAFVRRHLPEVLPAPVLLHMDLNDGNLMLEQRAGRWEVAGVLDFVASCCYHAPFDLVTPGVFFCRGEPDLLRALLEGAGASDLGPAELAAWHLLHPFSELPRDLAMAGRGDAPPSEAALLSLWSAR